MRRIYLAEVAGADGEVDSSSSVMEDLTAQQMKQIVDESRGVTEVELNSVVKEFVTDQISLIENAQPQPLGDHAKWLRYLATLQQQVKDGKLTQEMYEYAVKQRETKETLEVLKGVAKSTVNSVATLVKSEKYKLVDNHRAVYPKWYDRLVDHVDGEYFDSALGNGKIAITVDVLEANQKEIKAYEKSYGTKIKNWFDLIPTWKKINVMSQMLFYDHTDTYNGVAGFFSNAFGLASLPFFSIMEMAARQKATPNTKYKSPEEFFDYEGWQTQAAACHGPI